MASHAPPIDGHRVVGDGHTIALLRPDGEVDWWCVPTMDADPLLWSLLDPDGGAARFLDAAPDPAAGADDVPAAPFARTVLCTEGQRVEVIDALLPCAVGGSTLVRLLRALDGPARVRHEVYAAGFGGGPARWSGAEVDHAGRPWTVHAIGDATWSPSPRGGVVTELEVGRVQGDRPDAAIVLTADPTTDLRIEALIAQVDAILASEAARPEPRAGIHAERVRDALGVLQVCTYAATGALVAAPTTSLPEAPGHDRQFDYRYTWLRDSSMAASVAAHLGQVDRSAHHLRFLEELGPERLLTSPLFRVDGGAAPPEREVPGVRGWADSRPIRVGNDAIAQVQYDGPGFVNEAIDIHVQSGGELMPDLWAIVVTIADRSAEPDHARTSGIWELREPGDLVVADTGRWMALDHAVRLAEHRHLAVPPHWEHGRDEARARVVTAVRHDGLPQSYTGPPRPDASALLNVICGMIGPDDPRAHAVVDGVIEHLARPPLVWRYPPDATDGFAGREGAFIPASWWVVTALATLGRVDEAGSWADELCALLPSLLAEEITPSPDGPLSLGNVPLVWSHAEAARALYALDEATR